MQVIPSTIQTVIGDRARPLELEHVHSAKMRAYHNEGLNIINVILMDVYHCYDVWEITMLFSMIYKIILIFQSVLAYLLNSE